MEILSRSSAVWTAKLVSFQRKEKLQWTAGIKSREKTFTACALWNFSTRVFFLTILVFRYRQHSINVPQSLALYACEQFSFLPLKLEEGDFVFSHQFNIALMRRRKENGAGILLICDGARFCTNFHYLLLPCRCCCVVRTELLYVYTNCVNTNFLKNVPIWWVFKSSAREMYFLQFFLYLS